jgi:hypothetical protein
MLTTNANQTNCDETVVHFRADVERLVEQVCRRRRAGRCGGRLWTVAAQHVAARDLISIACNREHNIVFRR